MFSRQEKQQLMRPMHPDYSGLDPEVNINKARDGVPSLGIDYTTYPRARTLTIGVNATF
jgi:iron complex outermembrane receptor protein